MFSFIKNAGSKTLPAIDSHQLHRAMSAGDSPLILDVRRPEEYVEAHISGADLIPLHELPGRMNDLPRDRSIVCVCRSGSRSAAATAQLAAAGLHASNLSGGMIAWLGSGLPIVSGEGSQ